MMCDIDENWCGSYDNRVNLLILRLDIILYLCGGIFIYYSLNGRIMKKTVFMMAAFIAVTLTSCNGGGKDAAASGETTPVEQAEAPAAEAADENVSDKAKQLKADLEAARQKIFDEKTKDAIEEAGEAFDKMMAKALEDAETDPELKDIKDWLQEYKQVSDSIIVKHIMEDLRDMIE